MDKDEDMGNDPKVVSLEEEGDVAGNKNQDPVVVTNNEKRHINNDLGSPPRNPRRRRHTTDEAEGDDHACCNGGMTEEDFVKARGEEGEEDDDNRDTPDWDEERRHYLKIIATFQGYGRSVIEKLVSTSMYIKSLPETHKSLLIDYRKHLSLVKKCVNENQHLCNLISSFHAQLFQNQDQVYPENKLQQQPPPKPTNFDFEKVQAVFKQIARDWSTEGEAERDTCYRPIIEEVEDIFGHTKDKNGLSAVRILVPGAGVGRLAHELVYRGYTVEGNEFSLFMLFASNFLLNKCDKVNQHQCFPWIHQTTNVLQRSDQVRPISFPDISPSELPPNSRFSMVAGDFYQVYGTPSNKDSWDCVTTCFFIDCANNILTYLERIYYCLKMGGIWINMGPLLYHYADMAEEQSIEPPYDILRGIIQKLGFVIQKEETGRETLYSDNSKSMLQFRYKSVFLVCKKNKPPLPPPSSPAPSLTSSPIKSIPPDMFYGKTS